MTPHTYVDDTHNIETDHILLLTTHSWGSSIISFRCIEEYALIIFLKFHSSVDWSALRPVLLCMHTHSVHLGCLIPRRNDSDRLRVRVLIYFRFFPLSRFSRSQSAAFALVCLSSVFSFCAVWKKKSLTWYTVQYACVIVFPTFSGRMQRHTVHGARDWLPSSEPGLSGVADKHFCSSDVASANNKVSYCIC